MSDNRKYLLQVLAIGIGVVAVFCLCDAVAYGPPDNKPCAVDSKTIRWWDSCAWTVSDACIGAWQEKKVGARAGVLGGHFHSLVQTAKDEWKITYWHPVTRSSTKVVPRCKPKSKGES